MFPEATQLRDIDAVLGNPWWPLAPGWWLLLAALAVLALALWRFDLVWRLRVPIPLITLGSWRWDAGRELRQLRREATDASVKDTASELSELLRRIAMARHGRNACAGLHGADWLGWLAEHDPKGFDWRDQGRLLLAAPYAPPARTEAELNALLRLIDAAMEWVVAGQAKPVRVDSGSRGRRVVAWLKGRFSGLRWPGRAASISLGDTASR
ncbi:MAG: DUF4381 domain-containing protein [Thiohalocapsa sp.]